MTDLTVQRLDFRNVAPSRWHARHGNAFQTAGFAALKESLAHTGGNLVPVYVRPEGDRFVLAYGVLRHQACADLGLPVLAIVDPHMTEHELVGAMLAEAQGGTPLSAYELGVTVQSMLDTGLLPSRRRAAEHLGLMLKDLSGALGIANLPAAVLAAFDCPTQIRIPWAPKLLAVYERDPASFPARVVLARAERVRPDPERFSWLSLPASEALMKRNELRNLRAQRDHRFNLRWWCVFYWAALPPLSARPPRMASRAPRG